MAPSAIAIAGASDSLATSCFGMSLRAGRVGLGRVCSGKVLLSIAQVTRRVTGAVSRSVSGLATGGTTLACWVACVLVGGLAFAATSALVLGLPVAAASMELPRLLAAAGASAGMAALGEGTGSVA